MKFHNPEDLSKELTFDDVFIFQNFFEGKSRSSCNVKPSYLNTTIPILSANMNAVTGKRMCETLARYGGMGVLPQDMNFETIKKIIKHIKNTEIYYDTPLTVTKEDYIMSAMSLIHKKSHGIVVLVNENQEPVGYYDFNLLSKYDHFNFLGNIKYKKYISIERKDIKNNEQLYNFMDNTEHTNLLITENGKLIGIISKKDTIRNDIYKPALDKNGKLDLIVAIGVNQVNSNKIEEIEQMINMGISTFVIDTAHGYQQKMIDVLQILRKKFGDKIVIIAGNVSTKEGTKDLIEAGANGVKVGIGPGAMCTTRMATGVGRPQFSAILECSKEAKKYGGFVVADGGIKHPRDLALSMAAGASHIMIGTTFAGTLESVGEVKFDEQGFKYKENYGMASGKAVLNRNKDISNYEKEKRNFYKEGISSSKVYIRKGLESVGDVVDTFISGLKSSMTYVGVENLNDFNEKAIIGTQTASGYKEGTPHGELVK